MRFDALVLRGAINVLKNTDVILYECHELQLKKFGGPGTTNFQTFKLLQELGFDTFIGQKYFLMPISEKLYHPIYDSKPWQMSCWAVKKDYKYYNEFYNEKFHGPGEGCTWNEIKRLQ